MPLVLACALAAAPPPDGAAIFGKQCAVCHKEPPVNRAPLPEALQRLPKEAILQSLAGGSMKAQGDALTAEERDAVASFLAAKPAKAEAADAVRCAQPSPEFRNLNGWNGWSIGETNARQVTAAQAGFGAKDLGLLKLKWAFGFPGANAAFGQPTVVDGRLFVGSANGTLYSLEASSGCVYWTFKAPGTVRSAVTVGRAGGLAIAYFGDVAANVYAVNARTGELVWKAKTDEHPVARVTGAPRLEGGRLYVPVSSVEEVPPANPKYGCCTFRGSVVAYEAATGKQIWKTYSIPDPARPTRVNAAGTQLHGPAGGAIWTSPTIDRKNKVLYVGTGNSYADPAARTTDAVLAIELETGSVLWSKQLTPGDGWNFSCSNPNKSNCPEERGEDFDIGASPVLAELGGGKRLLLVGQKSGVVYGLDPERRGEMVWQTRVGKGSALGGVMWGMAAGRDALFVPVSDVNKGKPDEVGGLAALRIATGEKLWHAAPRRPECMGKFGCTAAQMAPATLLDSAVLSGAMDGTLRAYDAATGEVIWEFATNREFETVNGVKAKGGSLNGAGATAAGGMLFMLSGYGVLGGMAGNVLLAFGR